MAYADKQKEKEVKWKWYLENQDRVKAARERYNDKRRQARLDPTVLAQEAKRKRMKRLKMNEEEYAVYEQQKLEEKRKYHREWARAHYPTRYAKIKARMAADPEYAAKMKEQWTRNTNKRRARGVDETPEQRERRLQRDREYSAKKAREKKLMAQLTPAKPKAVTPKVTPPPPPQKLMPPIRKRGRFQALSKWHGI